ncbi:hypothetical protein [uncultured Alistipes sp.]|uniref:hypothetical protein n=1 Tax=Alistipes sp. TaxID=1872444 RepID=UPI002591B82B|nr:hypothetical protein [uncultured Alistipes sp.]
MASLVEQRFIEEILTSEGARLLKNQGAAFAARLRFHSKHLLEHRTVEVSADASGSGKLAFSHTAYQRFLDLKAIKYGSKVVRRNRKIHNRFIWGHFNSIAARLANDFTPSVAARIRAEIEKQ